MRISLRNLEYIKSGLIIDCTKMEKTEKLYLTRLYTSLYLVVLHLFAFCGQIQHAFTCPPEFLRVVHMEMYMSSK